MTERIFIGVAWPYANGPIHLGHVAGCYLPPDIFARYHRARGNRVLMVSGSDQHGTPITVTADREGVRPSDIAERYHRVNSKCMTDLGITFDLFTKTSHPAHREVVHDLFLTLLKKDHIYRKTMMASYCGECARYLPDRYVEGECPHCGSTGARGDQCDSCGRTLDPEELVDPKCKLCSSTPEMRETEHFFFRLSAFQDRLAEWVADKDHWRSNAKNFTKNWLDMGLRDRAITRDMEWGIDIPLEGFDKKRIYVWFEAVMGYLSTAKQWAANRGSPEEWRDFWEDPDCRHYYFLGKDNIPFHTIIWPSMLMGYGGLNLPYDVPANEYLRLGGAQFSKSRGVSIGVPDVLAEYDPDQVRYYLCANMPEIRDADFTWEDFVRRCNEELLSTLGNFIHRALTFTKRHFEKAPPPGEPGKQDLEALEQARVQHAEVAAAIEACEFKKALKALMELAHLSNRYFDSKAPWAQVKEDRAACGTTLNTSLFLVKALAVTMQPFMPHSAQKVWEMLGYTGSVAEVPWDEAVTGVPEGQALADPEPLFKVLELAEAEEEEEPTMEPLIQKLDLRVGKVVEVGAHPNADRLQVLTVDLGGEQRTLVAGLKPYYPGDSLKGKDIVVVTNLEPAKLRGVESSGMLLAADDGKGTVSLLSPFGTVEPGTRVTARGLPERELEGTIPFKEFQEVDLKADTRPEIGTAQVVMCTDEALEEGHAPLVAANGVFITLDRPVADGSKVR